MTEAEWLASADPYAMLAHLRGDGTATLRDWSLISDRKLRLFACACCRSVWPLMPDSLRVGIVFAEQEPFHQSVNHIHVAFLSQDALTEYSRFLGKDQCLDFACAWLGAANAREVVCQVSGWLQMLVTFPQQVAILHDIAGNPFRPVKPLRHTVRAAADMSAAALESGASEEEVWVPPWLAWNNSTVPKLAEAIYQDRAWDRMPILADALEDAGCTDQAILDHCRSTEPHARGCHVVDLILDKE